MEFDVSGPKQWAKWRSGGGVGRVVCGGDIKKYATPRCARWCWLERSYRSEVARRFIPGRPPAQRPSTQRAAHANPHSRRMYSTRSPPPGLVHDDARDARKAAQNIRSAAESRLFFESWTKRKWKTQKGKAELYRLRRRVAEIDLSLQYFDRRWISGNL